MEFLHQAKTLFLSIDWGIFTLIAGLVAIGFISGMLSLAVLAYTTNVKNPNPDRSQLKLFRALYKNFWNTASPQAQDEMVASIHAMPDRKNFACHHGVPFFMECHGCYDEHLQNYLSRATALGLY